MIKRLADEKHHSVFEKSSLHFLACTDVATHIQLLKHRIGVSINGESARYKELKEDKFYVPPDWGDDEVLMYTAHMEESMGRYHACLARLEKAGMDRKRAKESARFYLPYGNQLVVDVMFNFRSFAHFVGLRYSRHAQKEIRDLTGDMLALVSATGAFDETLRAFGFVDASGAVVEPST